MYFSNFQMISMKLEDGDGGSFSSIENILSENEINMLFHSWKIKYTCFEINQDLLEREHFSKLDLGSSKKSISSFNSKDSTLVWYTAILKHY